jgi:hypothetical protein
MPTVGTVEGVKFESASKRHRLKAGDGDPARSTEIPPPVGGVCLNIPSHAVKAVPYEVIDDCGKYQIADQPSYVRVSRFWSQIFLAALDFCEMRTRKVKAHGKY